MRRENWRSKVVLGVAAVSGFAINALPVWANEPIPEAHLKIRVEMKSNRMGELVVQNDEDVPAEIDFKIAHHATIHEFSGIPIRPIHVGVPSHQEARGQFQFEAPTGGVMVVHFESRVTLGNHKVKNGPIFYQVYKSTPNGLQEVSYEDAFLTKRVETLKHGESSRAAQLKIGGGFVAQVPLERVAFKAHVMEAAQAGQIQVVKLGSPIEMANKYALRALPATGGREHEGGTVVGPIHHPFPIPTPIHHVDASFLTDMADTVLPNIDDDAQKQVMGFALESSTEKLNDELGADARDSLLDASPNDMNMMSNFTLKGHMSTKYNDGTFHGAWGWVVTAWQNENGNYTALGWTYVNGDGSWQIPLGSSATSSSQVYVQYQTANRFVQVQDPTGNVYTWGDWWSLSGGTTDIGYRFADLSASGDLPGIDKLYEGATDEWSKFYYNGMNALRDKPIQVTYPNSLASGHCINNTDSSGKKVPQYAWSCSEWSDGKIWIIPAHGDKSVVQHEAAHSINSYYWNGNMSSGAGGPHSLDGCYNGGLALTEGFANFVAYWVQFDRTATSPVASYFNEDIETYTGDNGCSSGDINEMRVAANMWDMYDTSNDGPDATHSDGWYYINPASPVSIVLSNGTKQKESDYLSVVDAGDSTWFAADRDLFRLNKIIP